MYILLFLDKLVEKYTKGEIYMKKLKVLAMSLFMAASLGTIAQAATYSNTIYTSKNYSVLCNTNVSGINLYAGTYMNYNADLITVGIYDTNGTNESYNQAQNANGVTTSKAVYTGSFNYNVQHKVCSVTYGNAYQQFTASR